MSFAALIPVVTLAAVISAPAGSNTTANLTPQAFLDWASPPQAVVCHLQGERVSGMNKICYYDCLGSEVAITVKATDLCPLTINR